MLQIWVTPEFLVQASIAAILGAVLGYEREALHKPAGLRTYIMVCLGAMLFAALSNMIGSDPSLDAPADPTRIAAQIVTGIGFIGAGVIMKRDDHVEGVTTASGLWLCGAIGVAVGFGYIGMAVVTTLLGLGILHMARQSRKK